MGLKITFTFTDINLQSRRVYDVKTKTQHLS